MAEACSGRVVGEWVKKPKVTLMLLIQKEPIMWVPVLDFPDYEVNDVGEVRRKDGRVCKQHISSCGYPAVRVRRDGKSHTKHVHVLVCAAFHGGKPSPKHEVAHWDGDRRNACAMNLRWATRTENFADMIRHGTRAFGESNHLEKLTDSGVREIKRRLAAGESPTAIARSVGHSRQGINSIKSGRQWAHIQWAGEQ